MSYGISMTTLEEVFIASNKIHEEKKEEKEDTPDDLLSQPIKSQVSRLSVNTIGDESSRESLIGEA